MSTEVMGANAPRKDSAHSDECESSDLVAGVVHECLIKKTYSAAEHSADEECGREESARAAATVREDRRHYLHCAKSKQYFNSQLAGERPCERVIAAAGHTPGP